MNTVTQIHGRIISDWLARPKVAAEDLRNDRDAQIDMMVRFAPGRFTAETARAHLDQSDRMKMALAIGSAASASRDFKTMRPIAISPAGATPSAPTADRGPFMVSPNVSALNVDIVLANKDAFANRDYTGQRVVALYAEAIRSQADRSMDKNGYVDFYGAWGKDRVTNDVEEYIGWLQEAAGMAAAGAQAIQDTAPPSAPQASYPEDAKRRVIDALSDNSAVADTAHAEVMRQSLQIDRYAEIHG